MFERTKKPGDPVDSPVTGNAPSPASSPAAETAARPAPAPTPANRGRATAVIGPSIQIEGTLRGQEDVFVEGEVTGTVQLQSNTLTIGTTGKIRADVYAHTVFVEGSMEGDLIGSEQVIVRKSAKVKGNITSPRVTLEDGASFKGSIEMDPESVKAALGSAGASRGPSTARQGSGPQAVAGGNLGNVGGQAR
jgi:cytoskeletal protein CcmA (bactofilin family)